MAGEESIILHRILGCERVADYAMLVVAAKKEDYETARRMERAGGCRWIERGSVVTIQSVHVAGYLLVEEKGKNFGLWISAEFVCNRANAIISGNPRPPHRTDCTP
jgi:hypothetical protein